MRLSVIASAPPIVGCCCADDAHPTYNDVAIGVIQELGSLYCLVSPFLGLFALTEHSFYLVNIYHFAVITKHARRYYVVQPHPARRTHYGGHIGSPGVRSTGPYPTAQHIQSC